MNYWMMVQKKFNIFCILTFFFLYGETNEGDVPTIVLHGPYRDFNSAMPELLPARTLHRLQQLLLLLRPIPAQPRCGLFDRVEI